MNAKNGEVGQVMSNRMKEMELNARIIHERTGIPCTTLSEFFRNITFKKCFDTLEKLADVLNIMSLTIIFKDQTSEEYKELNGEPDNIDLNTLLPEYRKQVLKLVEKSNKQKKDMAIKEKETNKKPIEERNKIIERSKTKKEK